MPDWRLLWPNRRSRFAVAPYAELDQTDFQVVFHAGRSHYSELLEAGVEIYERQNVLLHSKTALIDGVWSCVGSTNLDWRSFVHNNEIDAVVLAEMRVFSAHHRAGQIRRHRMEVDPLPRDRRPRETAPDHQRRNRMTGAVK